MENTNVRSKKVGLRTALRALFMSQKEEEVNEKLVEKFNSNLDAIVLSEEEQANARRYRVDGGSVPVRNEMEKTGKNESRNNKGLER